MRMKGIVSLVAAGAICAGCGGIVSSCTKAAVKTGAGSAARIGVGTGVKGGAFVLEAESAARAARGLPHGVAREGESVTGSSSNVTRSGERGSRESWLEDKGTDLVQEGLKKGAEQAFDAGRNQNSNGARYDCSEGTNKTPQAKRCP
jgi:hypothetical protein